MKTQRKRTCAKMICICLMLSLVPSPVSAAETGEAVGSHEHTSEDAVPGHVAQFHLITGTLEHFRGVGDGIAVGHLFVVQEFLSLIHI